MVRGYMRMFVAALRTIDAGEELTCGYGRTYADDNDMFVPCLCGTEKCSKWIGIPKGREEEERRKNPHKFPVEVVIEIEEVEQEQGGEKDGGHEEDVMNADNDIESQEDDDLDEDGNAGSGIMTQGEGMFMADAFEEEAANYQASSALSTIIREEEAGVHPLAHAYVVEYNQLVERNASRGGAGAMACAGTDRDPFVCPFPTCRAKSYKNQDAIKHVCSMHAECAGDVAVILNRDFTADIVLSDRWSAGWKRYAKQNK
jgi:hypothetical protein